MVDNHIDARPQSGLSNADVIYEAVTEAGITRFMAVYANKEADVVGPIRSGRHYFVYWASEYNGIYVHIGASPQGFDALAATGLTSIGAANHWRTSDREAPHNAYVSTTQLRAVVRDKGRGQLSGLEFGAYDTTASGTRIKSIKITYPDGYTVRYEYEENTNSYARFMEGLPHVDAWSGTQYRAKNVIVEFLETWRIPGDPEGRVDMTLVGRGKAYAFTGGKATEGSWVKDRLTGPTRFIGSGGENVVLNPGQTWIQVVPLGGSVSYQ